jgi:hypothetical protein
MQMPEGADDRILNAIYENERKHASKSSFYMKKVIAATLVFVIAVSSLTYAGMRLWDFDVAEKFGVLNDNTKMQDLADEKFSSYMGGNQEKSLSVSDQGITVEAIQTLCDERYGYIYFTVDFGDTYQVKEDEIPLPDIEFSTSDKKMDLNGGVSKEKVYNDHKVGYSSYISPVDEEQTMKEIKIIMTISRFYNGSYDEATNTYNDTVVAKGNWCLSWELSTGTQKRLYEVNQMITYEGLQFKIKEFEISPLSCMVTTEVMDKDSYETFLSEKKNIGLTSLYLGVKKTGHIGSSIIYSMTDETTSIIEKMQFDKVMDLDTVTGFCYGDTKIDLTKLEYTSEE